MKKNHYGLYAKAGLINEIAVMAIDFFNENVPMSKKRDGLRICFKDCDSGEDVLNICAGTFPLEKSESLFLGSREKAKLVSGAAAPLSTRNITGVSQGGTKGFLYSIGVSGQESENNETIGTAIIFFVELKLFLDYSNNDYDLTKKNYNERLEKLFDKESESRKRFDNFVEYLISKEDILMTKLHICW